MWNFVQTVSWAQDQAREPGAVRQGYATLFLVTQMLLIVLNFINDNNPGMYLYYVVYVV